MPELKIHTYLLTASIFIGVAYLRKFSKQEYIIFGFVCYVLFVDLFAVFAIAGPNTWYYNITGLVQQVSILFFYAFIAPIRYKKTIFVIAITTLILGLLNYTSGQGTDEFNSITITFFGLIIGLISYQLLRNIVLSRDVRRAASVGFLVANLFYFVLTTTILTSVPLLVKLDMPRATELFQINHFAFSLWIVFITTGFIWTKR
ncbi:MAG: hypothetical protein COA58_05225 [Bacteroidetes bacterium]|nr:MAG: hypothetical protein COA58_05225 [Bacteroidota bacterium]